MARCHLINRPKRFHSFSVVEIGFNDYNKLIISGFNAYFKKLPPFKRLNTETIKVSILAVSCVT